VNRVVRYRCGSARLTSLTGADHRVLDRVLRNEMDMAYRRRTRILLEYLELRDGLSVLDCGCGMGFYLLALSRLRRLDLVGIDTDPIRLEQARRAAPAARLERADVARLPFDDRCFDRVLMTEVLEHVDDDLGALREVRRVLRPGGILAVSVPNAGFPFWWDPINRVWTALGGDPIREGPVAGMWSNHVRLYRPSEVADAVAAAGFEVEILEEATHYALPLSHFLVYGVGKPLLERNLLPESLRRSSDRLMGEDNTASALNPVNAARIVVDLADRLNEHPRVRRKRTFVNVLLKARRPR
jgi:SAM-dependent methyltransferase